MVAVAGLRAALWTGQNDGVDRIARVLADGERAHPYSVPFLAAGRAMHCLLRGDAAAAVPLLEDACARADDLAPVCVPRWRLHLAYALARAGRHGEALLAAAEAAAGCARLGNAVEEARSRAMGLAIREGRVGRSRTALDWLARLEAAVATVRREPTADGRTVLVESVARATGATAVWLVGGAAAEPRVLARAGSCATADPLAWREAMSDALGRGETSDRAGVGLVLPVGLLDARLALVIEDRAYPQAVSPEAAAVARQVVAASLAELDRRKVAGDLAAWRRALARRSATTPPPTEIANTAAAPVSPSPAPGGQRFEPTLDPVERRHAFPRIVSRSSVMRRALGVLDRMVDVDVNVLILGETGTGKELCARALHEQGPRAARPFVAVNCAAVPPELAESEFFGSVPGAFTGAARARRAGYFEQAAGGTLFLDEVAELAPATQAKLLRVLEAGEVRPVGAESALPVDVRIVAATHRDLTEAVEERSFRRDLFFRIAVVEVTLPPLRDRPEDIPALVRLLLAGREARPTVAPAVLDALVAYPWPGNVRELQNELDRAAALSTGGVIRPENLSPRIGIPPAAVTKTGDLLATLRETERRLIVEALRQANGNKTHAARVLGLDRVGLLGRMRRRGLLASPTDAWPRSVARRDTR